MKTKALATLTFEQIMNNFPTWQNQFAHPVGDPIPAGLWFIKAMVPLAVSDPVPASGGLRDGRLPPIGARVSASSWLLWSAGLAASKKTALSIAMLSVNEPPMLSLAQVLTI